MFQHKFKKWLALDFSEMDSKSINNALAQGGKNAQYLLIHIVESVGAYIMGGETGDNETHEDMRSLLQYADQLRALGYDVEIKLEFGNPKKKIPIIVKN